jgi:phospholipase/carboxylesterase
MTPDDNLSLDHSLPAETKLYYDLKLPERKPAPLLLALHGYGANKKQMMREARQMAPEDFAIASLQGFHQHMREPKEPGGPLRFGFGWLTNFRPEESVAMHHHALLDLIARLTDEGIVDSERIFLLGFSQSCALNYRFAFTHADLLRGVVGICGGIPGDWATSESYEPTKTAVFHLAGSRDQFYPPERVADYEKQLGTRSESVIFRTYDAPHEIVPDMRVDVRDWFVKHTGS